MTILTKNGGTKTVSNEDNIKKLIASGWVLVQEAVEKEVKKDGKSGKSNNK